MSRYLIDPRLRASSSYAQQPTPQHYQTQQYCQSTQLNNQPHNITIHIHPNSHQFMLHTQTQNQKHDSYHQQPYTATTSYHSPDEAYFDVTVSYHGTQPMYTQISHHSSTQTSLAKAPKQRMSFKHHKNHFFVSKKNESMS